MSSLVVEFLGQSNIDAVTGRPAIVTEAKVHLFRAEKAEERASRLYLPRVLSKHVYILSTSSLSYEELCTFLGPSVLTSLSALQLLIDPSKGRQTSCILDFQTEKDASTFYMEYNGKPFSGCCNNRPVLEECHLLFLEDVLFIEPLDNEERIKIPAGKSELPSCVACLERLDTNVNGLLNVICNHSFHCECSQRWSEVRANCSVCAMCDKPYQIGISCSSCELNENLWMCLICGYIGCSRYTNKHSYEHYKSTGHSFALQLGSCYIWDYTRDSYCQKVSENDRSSIYASHSSESNRIEKPSAAVESEASELLTATLESQRLFYENLIALEEKKQILKIELMEHKFALLLHEKEECSIKVKTLEEEREEMDKIRLELTAKISKIKQEEQQLRKSAREKERQQEEALQSITKIKGQEKDPEKEERIKELEEQVRDLQFFIEAQKKLADDSELQDGQVIKLASPNRNNSSQQPPTASRGKRTPKKNKRGKGRK